jgi:CBS domain-containing protein
MKCSEVMTKDPSCCLPTDTVFEAAKLMKSEDVGPIPVVSDNEGKTLEGIITDRDLTLKIVAEGLDPKSKKVKDVMTTEVVTCGPDDNANQALELMEHHQVRRIPIVNENKRLVGIIAQADVATRMKGQQKTGEVVKEISRAA